jgi:hypothetical protein
MSNVEQFEKAVTETGARKRCVLCGAPGERSGW